MHPVPTITRSVRTCDLPWLWRYPYRWGRCRQHSAADKIAIPARFLGKSCASCLSRRSWHRKTPDRGATTPRPWRRDTGPLAEPAGPRGRRTGGPRRLRLDRDRRRAWRVGPGRHPSPPDRRARGRGAGARERDVDPEAGARHRRADGPRADGRHGRRSARRGRRLSLPAGRDARGRAMPWRGRRSYGFDAGYPARANTVVSVWVQAESRAALAEPRGDLRRAGGRLCLPRARRSLGRHGVAPPPTRSYTARCGRHRPHRRCGTAPGIFAADPGAGSRRARGW